MCGSSAPPPPPPPPAPPPVLEQIAPKSASSGESNPKRKSRGLSRYKINENAQSTSTGNNILGGISKKTGTGVSKP